MQFLGCYPIIQFGVQVMKLKGIKTLVTGAGGFIGSHLVEALVNEGCNVRAFLRNNSRNEYGYLKSLGNKLNDIEIFTGDLRDEEAVRNAVHGQQLVFHLGALTDVPYSYQSPRDVFATNVDGTLNVLEAARESGTEKIVITSSSEVYGIPLYVPVDEKHPLQAQNPYAASKIAADKLAESYFESFELPVAVLRPFDTFGPRQSAGSVIPAIIIQALAEGKIRIGSLQPRRDLLYVQDTVSGFIAMAQSEKGIGKVMNVGTGCDLSIGDLVEEILTIMGIQAEIIQDDMCSQPTRKEVQKLVCNYSRAQDLFGWQPRYSLEEGLRVTIAWIKDHIKEYKSDLYSV